MKRLIFLYSATIASPALADCASDPENCVVVADYRTPETSIVVSATGERAPLDQVGQAISVVGEDELDRVQATDLIRVLNRLPGVSLSRNGGVGAQTGLNVRGANADQVLVLIDGIRVADYASPGGSYDLGNLLGGNLAKLELLRGANSVVWGSQAIGGVLAVQSRDLEGFAGSAEYGGYDTVLANASAGLRGYSYAASISAGYARSNGFSAQAGGTEPDGYDQWNLSGRLRLDLSDDFALHAVGRHADSHLGFDQLGPDSPDFQDTRETSGRLALGYDGDRLELTGSVTYTDVRRDYETGFGPSSFTGRSWRADLQGQAELSDQLVLLAGADTEWTRAGSSYDADARARQSSGHSLLTWSGDGLSLSGGLRIDQHDRFGTHLTLGANGAADLGRGWRLRASYGEGFKAPSLYQLYGGWVGNTALQPETSHSYDVGIERGDRNAGLHLALTAFRRDSRNLIDLDSGFVYKNVARARAQGIELELGVQVTPLFRAQAAYTYLDARDLTHMRDLARRPHHALALSADWITPLTRLALGADLRLQGDSVEYSAAGTPSRLDGFAIATLRATVPLAHRIELYGRIENAGNVRYQTAVGYNAPGRSAYVGLRARF